VGLCLENGYLPLLKEAELLHNFFSISLPALLRTAVLSPIYLDLVKEDIIACLNYAKVVISGKSLKEVA